MILFEIFFTIMIFFIIYKIVQLIKITEKVNKELDEKFKAIYGDTFGEDEEKEE